MGKRLLLTGIQGFVGHSTFEHIMKNTDWDVVGVDSLRKDHKGDSLRLHQVIESHPEWRKRLELYRVDLSGPISHRLAAVIGEVDYVLNVASRSHVDDSISDPVPFIQENVAVATTIGEYCRATKPKKLIQCSTDEVFGPAVNNYSHKEWEVFRPSNPYSASKASQNAILYSYWRTFGVPVMYTHCMNMISERQDPEKFVPMCIGKIYRGETVTIHGSESAVGSRKYIHSRNLADAWLFLLKNVEPVFYQDVDELQDPAAFNIAGQKQMTNLEVAQMIANILGKELKYEFVDFHSVRPGHDRAYSLDSSKIRALGWQEPVSFEESLQKMVEWTLRNKEWML